MLEAASAFIFPDLLQEDSSLPNLPVGEMMGRDCPSDPHSSDRYSPRNQVFPIPALSQELTLTLFLEKFGKFGEKLHTATVRLHKLK